MEEREENTEMIVYPLPNGRRQVALTARDGAVWASQTPTGYIRRRKLQKSETGY